MFSNISYVRYSKSTTCKMTGRGLLGVCSKPNNLFCSSWNKYSYMFSFTTEAILGRCRKRLSHCEGCNQHRNHFFVLFYSVLWWILNLPFYILGFPSMQLWSLTVPFAAFSIIYANLIHILSHWQRLCAISVVCQVSSCNHICTFAYL